VTAPVVESVTWSLSYLNANFSPLILYKPIMSSIILTFALNGSKTLVSRSMGRKYILPIYEPKQGEERNT
jgi:hypothetical protein